jgi:hypothetical protein
MRLEYGKLIAGMPYQDLRDKQKVLTNLLEAYLASVASAQQAQAYHHALLPLDPSQKKSIQSRRIYNNKGSLFWLQSTATITDQWICKKLLRLLETQNLDALLTTVNTHLKIPSDSEPSKIFSTLFSVFPELMPATRQPTLPRDFSWILHHFNQLTEHYLQVTHGKDSNAKFAACAALKSACSAATAEQTEQIVFAMLPLTTQKETLTVRMAAFETMVIAAEHADQFFKNMAIDTMLHTLCNDINLLDAFLLPLLAIAANHASPEKKAIVTARLSLYLQRPISNIWNAAVDAMTLLDPGCVSAEMHAWRDKAKERFSLLSHRAIKSPSPEIKDTLKKCGSTPILSFYDNEEEVNKENAARYVDQIVYIRDNALLAAAPGKDVMPQLAELAKLQAAGKLAQRVAPAFLQQSQYNQVKFDKIHACLTV